MSKQTENDHQTDSQGDPGGNRPPSNKHEQPTVEEHAQKLKVDAPVFAAVMESNKWASGKRVPVTVFEKAVKDFLGASMGGA
jgi:hypothetical protein